MKFKDDIHPDIQRLVQRRTYYTVLEGVPDPAINRRMLQHTEAEARRYFGIERIHLIPPVETIQKTATREMAFLPATICMAELSHHQPMKDQNMEHSRMVLIWFQDEYAFPIAPDILEKIAALEWKTHSEDAYL